jgi:serine palmitoyltransferase
VRSAMELFLFLFAVYYLVSPAYSTKKQKQIPLTEEVRSEYSHLMPAAH